MLQPLNGRVAFVGGARCNRMQRQPLVLGPFSIQAAKLDFTPFPASRGKFVVADLRLGTRAEKPSRREEKPMGSQPLTSRS